MNYNVIIFRNTKKGHEETLKSFVVSSENDQRDLHVYFSEKYKGFNISVLSVESIDLDIIKTKETMVETRYGYRSYNVDRVISSKELSQDLQDAWNALDKSYKELHEKSCYQFISKYETNPGVGEMKPYSIIFPVRPKIQINLTSDFIKPIGD